MARKSRAAVAADLKAVIGEATEIVEKVGATSRRFSLEGTATLVGSFGGFVGVSLAYALAIAAPPVSFTVAAPLALGLGLTGSLLIFRGTSSAKLDREMDNRRRAANYILEQIKQLPKSAPKDVRDGLYIEYHRIVTNSEPPAPLALPAPRGGAQDAGD